MNDLKACVLLVVVGFSFSSLADAGDPVPFPFAAINNDGAISSFVSVDVDSDGDIDLVAAYELEDSVRVYRNDGQGAFVVDPDVYPAEDPGQMQAVDVNNDGHMDCVWKSETNRLHAILNDGTGAFLASSELLDVQMGNTHRFVDFDGDGDQDIVDMVGGIRVFLNDGTGAFQMNRTAGSGTFRNVFAVGDVDNDGDMDVVSYSSDFSNPQLGYFANVFLNLGDGSFAPSVEYSLGLNARGIELYDLTGDGVLDIVVPKSNAIARLSGIGDGTFSETVYEVSVWGAELFVFEDMDKDGDLDFVVSSGVGNGGLSIRLNNGDGTFPFFSETGWSQSRLHWAAHGVADYNGDGYADVGMVADGYLYIYQQRIHGGQEYMDFARPSALGSFGHKLRGMGDWNGDGFLEFCLFSTQTAVDIVVVSVDSDGLPAQQIASIDLMLGYVNTLGFEDFNQDGVVDFAFATREDEAVLKIFAGDGQGGFSLLSTQTQFGRLGTQFIKDFDGDGDSDIIVWTTTATANYALIMRNNGAGVFTRIGFYQIEGSRLIGFLDINLDGHDDILIRGSDAIHVRYGEGGGVFGEEVVLFHHAFDWDVWSYNITDLEGDGQLEFVVKFVDSEHNDGAPAFQLIRMIEGQYQAFDYHAGLGRVHGVSVVDIDGDGRMEIMLSRNSLPEFVAVYKLTETYELDRWFTLPGTDTYKAVDYDNDGDADLVGVDDLDVFESELASADLCIIDFNVDGALNFLDVSYFLENQIDLNDDGVFNFLDISLFLQLFSAGCP